MPKPSEQLQTRKPDAISKALDCVGSATGSGAERKDKKGGLEGGAQKLAAKKAF